MPMRPFRLLLAFLALTSCVAAQTLARPGWVGSGLNVEPWWTHAVLYRLDPHRFSGDGLRGATRQIDFIHSLGVDAIVLTRIPAAAAAPSVDPALGSLDDFDDLVREASRSGLRVLLELDPSAPELKQTARFWLGHGVAGLSLQAPSTAQLASLRGVLKSFTGQRILIAETTAGGPPQVEGADLTVVGLPATFDAAILRPLLQRLSAASGTRPVATLPSPATADTAKVLGTLLLATHTNAELEAGEELGAASVTAPEIAAQEADPGSTLNVYRRLIDLHHGNGVFRSGSVDFLDRDAQNALVWVMRKPQITPTAPALVVACNLSAQPVTLTLTDDLRGLHLRGSFLRTLLRSDKGLGGVGLNAVTLPPFAVYIGELRF